MTKIVGLTGGIGSGKTTVAKQFEALGIPVFIADDEAAKIVEAPETIKLLKAVFGPEIIEAGLVNRKKLAEIVFDNPERLQKLNCIVHPLVGKSFDKWIQKFIGRPFVIKEAAILFESGSYLGCDKIITVTAPEQIRIQRVMERDNASYDSVVKRIKNQWPDEMKIAKSDFVIENTNPENTKNQVRKIFAELTNS